MSKCEQCLALDGALSEIEPHRALKNSESRKIRGAYGMASGHVEFYTCSACGTKWGRDCDRKDKGASWYVIKEG